ncbi:hypothetical protein N7V09_09165 [Shewanella seohaensis]|nr:hypothetical protein N7V09_09165 [Shewanella seohaensis]
MEHSVPLISDVATSEDALQLLNQMDTEFLVVVNKAQHAIGVIGWRTIAMANKDRQEAERLI